MKSHFFSLDIVSWVLLNKISISMQVGVFDATNSTKARRDLLTKLAEGKCKVKIVHTLLKAYVF